MRWLALLCCLGAGASLATSFFLPEPAPAEQDRILHLLNEPFTSGLVLEEGEELHERDASGVREATD